MSLSGLQGQRAPPEKGPLDLLGENTLKTRVSPLQLDGAQLSHL